MELFDILSPDFQDNASPLWYYDRPTDFDGLKTPFDFQRPPTPYSDHRKSSLSSEDQDFPLPAFMSYVQTTPPPSYIQPTPPPHFVQSNPLPLSHVHEFKLGPNAYKAPKLPSYAFMQVDTPDGPMFQCTEPGCDKKYRVKGTNAKSHWMIHNNIMLFGCRTCSKRFTRKNDCIRHEKLHEKEF